MYNWVGRTFVKLFPAPRVADMQYSLQEFLEQNFIFLPMTALFGGWMGGLITPRQVGYTFVLALVFLALKIRLKEIRDGN